MVTIQNFTPLIGFLLLWALTGCQMFGIGEESEKLSVEVSGLHTTLFVGSKYPIRVTLRNIRHPASITVSMSDSIILRDSQPYFESADFQWKSRSRHDTLRIVVQADNGVFTLTHPFKFAYLSGFAPIDSPQVRRYKKQVSSGCWAYGGSVDSTLVTLTPLQSIDERYVFERKEEGVFKTYGANTQTVESPVLRVDTVELKMQGNSVYVKTASQNWTQSTRTSFPYFVQDTISEELADDYIGNGNDLGVLGAYGFQGRAVYRAGYGLLEYKQITNEQMCGSAGIFIDLQ
jgi:hypothetical protein